MPDSMECGGTHWWVHLPNGSPFHAFRREDGAKKKSRQFAGFSFRLSPETYYKTSICHLGWHNSTYNLVHAVVAHNYKAGN